VATKQDLHRLIDELPESAVPKAAEFLEELSDELAGLPASLRDAPWDDEPETPEEQEAVRQALEDIRAGRVVSHEEARRRLLDDE
jgi:O6-methylguanine-DNA--protein-cysteine methyltransferase